MDNRDTSAGRVEMVPIGSLELDPANPNTRTSLDDLRASLKEFGQHRPIVARKDPPHRVIIGNHTLKAARAEGWTHVMALYVEDDDLKAVRRGLADNRVGEQRSFDDPLLQSLLDVAGADIPGFDDAYMGDLMGRLAPPDLDALAEEHGEPGVDDFWPVLRIKLPPELKVAWDEVRSTHESDLDTLKSLLS